MGGLSDARLVWNIYSHGLLTDQNQYFNGSLNHVYCLRLAVKLAACARVCSVLNVELAFMASHFVCIIKHQSMRCNTEEKHHVALSYIIG